MNGLGISPGLVTDLGEAYVGILEPHRPKLVFLSAASLDEPERYKPTMDIYTDSSYAWDILDQKLEHYPRMPPTISDDFGR